jgi:hypothetical protein
MKHYRAAPQAAPFTHRGICGGQERVVDAPGRLGDSLAVELPALDRAALVRIQVPQPAKSSKRLLSFLSRPPRTPAACGPCRFRSVRGRRRGQRRPMAFASLSTSPLKCRAKFDARSWSGPAAEPPDRCGQPSHRWIEALPKSYMFSRRLGCRTTRLPSVRDPSNAIPRISSSRRAYAVATLDLGSSCHDRAAPPGSAGPATIEPGRIEARRNRKSERLPASR